MFDEGLGVEEASQKTDLNLGHGVSGVAIEEYHVESTTVEVS